MEQLWRSFFDDLMRSLVPGPGAGLGLVTSELERTFPDGIECVTVDDLEVAVSWARLREPSSGVDYRDKDHLVLLADELAGVLIEKTEAGTPGGLSHKEFRDLVDDPGSPIGKLAKTMAGIDPRLSTSQCFFEDLQKLTTDRAICVRYLSCSNPRKGRYYAFQGRYPGDRGWFRPLDTLFLSEEEVNDIQSRNRGRLVCPLPAPIAARLVCASTWVLMNVRVAFAHTTDVDLEFHLSRQGHLRLLPDGEDAYTCFERNNSARTNGFAAANCVLSGIWLPQLGGK